MTTPSEAAREVIECLLDLDDATKLKSDELLLRLALSKSSDAPWCCAVLNAREFLANHREREQGRAGVSETARTGCDLADALGDHSAPTPGSSPPRTLEDEARAQIPVGLSIDEQASNVAAFARRHAREAVERARVDGWADGVREYAVWRDGSQLVGVMERPLADVLRAGPSGASPDSKAAHSAIRARSGGGA